MCIGEQTLNATPLTTVSSDVNDLKALDFNQFLLCSKIVSLPYLPCEGRLVDHQKLFRQTRPYASLIWDKFRKKCLTTVINFKNDNPRQSKNFEKGDLV